MKNKLLLAAVSLTLFVSLTTSGHGADPSATSVELVRVEGGIVRGSTENEFIAFRGIPYAAPPVGELRWRNPQPVRTWEGVW